MAIEYETPTALAQFSLIQFKTVMKIADIDEATYSMILRAIFDNLNTQYDIDVDNLTEITFDFTLAVYRHAKFLFELLDKNLDVIDKTSDTSGNKTTFNAQPPKEVCSVYKMYSPVAPALL